MAGLTERGAGVGPVGSGLQALLRWVRPTFDYATGARPTLDIGYFANGVPVAPNPTPNALPQINPVGKLLGGLLGGVVGTVVGGPVGGMIGGAIGGQLGSRVTTAPRSSSPCSGR